MNDALVTKERGSLSEPSVVALRAVKEAIRFLGSGTKVPISKDFIHAVKHAHSEYALSGKSVQTSITGRRRKAKEGGG